MTEEELIALTLGLPEAAQHAHFEARDFLVRGKIFMTLPGHDFCALYLTPDQQRMALTAAPDVVAIVQGGWGERGLTRLYYAAAEETTVRNLVLQAWRNAAPRSMTSREG
jgi:hypothetical protein